MNRKTRNMTHAAIIGAMYFTLTHMQNLLLPGSTTWAIQCRLSEAMCVLAFFTPSAISGLTIGCLLFNMTYAGALPLDFLVGSLATVLAAWAMWMTRKITFRGYPWLGMLMPALTNAVLVGWELTVYLGDSGFAMAAFWINAVYVALGELIVLLSLGSVVYYTMKNRGLAQQLFG